MPTPLEGQDSDLRQRKKGQVSRQTQSTVQSLTVAGHHHWPLAVLDECLEGAPELAVIPKYNINFLSTGDILRQQIKDKTDVGRAAETIVARGGEAIRHSCADGAARGPATNRY